MTKSQSFKRRLRKEKAKNHELKKPKKINFLSMGYLIKIERKKLEEKYNDI